ncbi:MAG: metallophosphoesterase [Desulfobacterales bacterium]|nr:metallophosphoesterase [Desulfobacterales bacterium]
MRVYNVSDLHVDYNENLKWVNGISEFEYKNDILILNGDISDKITLIADVFKKLKKCFSYIMFVPGNHDLWVREGSANSVEKFQEIQKVADEYGIHTEEVSFNKLRIVPLLGWYDYSFGLPTDNLHNMWNDFNFCNWPDDYDYFLITEMFTNLNKINKKQDDEFVISFSHFLPNIDVMPPFIPTDKRFIYPVLGSNLIGEQVKKLESDIHIYGHSHVNNKVIIDNTLYINNAYGYPSEKNICCKKIVKIYEF